MPSDALKFGIFLTPRHGLRNSKNKIALARDLELIELLDDLGYDYAWVSEHHSNEPETIALTEEFVAAAISRTSNIRPGICVSALVCHQPLMLADRIMQLELTTGGRAVFGIEPDTLPQDTRMAGIDPRYQYDMMTAAMEVLDPLLRREMAIASQVSPAGAAMAGTHGLGLLCLGATIPGGFNALAVNWEVYERKARENHQTIDRRNCSLVGPVHIAETREQAFENVRFGLDAWLRYVQNLVTFTLTPDVGDPAEALVANGLAVIGTPDDAVTQLHRLTRQSGGFGTFLHMAHHWADRERTKLSYQLFARHVMPCFSEPALQNRKN